MNLISSCQADAESVMEKPFQISDADLLDLEDVGDLKKCEVIRTQGKLWENLMFSNSQTLRTRRNIRDQLTSSVIFLITLLVCFATALPNHIL